jgi:hypothetical protein
LAGSRCVVGLVAGCQLLDLMQELGVRPEAADHVVEAGVDELAMGDALGVVVKALDNPSQVIGRDRDCVGLAFVVVFGSEYVVEQTHVLLEATPQRLRLRVLAGVESTVDGTRQLTLEATVDAALTTDAEAKQPPRGRPSLMFDIAGAGFEPATAPRLMLWSVITT